MISVWTEPVPTIPFALLKDLSNYQQSLLSDFENHNFLQHIIFKNTLI